MWDDFGQIIMAQGEKSICYAIETNATSFQLQWSFIGFLYIATLLN